MNKAEHTFYAIHPKDFADLNAEHNFTVDACADKQNYRLSRYWTTEDDALSQNWQGESLWLHPPYDDSLLINGLLDRMLNSEASSALALLPGWAISQHYWRRLASSIATTVTLARRLRPFVAPGFPAFTPDFPLFFLRSL